VKDVKIKLAVNIFQQEFIFQNVIIMRIKKMTRSGPTCKECKSNDTRLHACKENKEKILYYRCKSCGFLWDNDEIIIKRKDGGNDEK